jgi:hypothetical protein
MNELGHAGEFFDLAQRMLRELFGHPWSDDEPWAAAATRRPPERSESPQGTREFSADGSARTSRSRLVRAPSRRSRIWRSTSAAVRQRLERTDQQASGSRPGSEGRGPHRIDAGGQWPGGGHAVPPRGSTSPDAMSATGSNGGT